MKPILVLLLLVVGALSGCGPSRTDRAQAAADLDAGLVAAIDAIANHATADAIAILTGARKYVAPAAGVPRAELPVPRLSPQDIRRDPKAYGDSAPPDPQPWTFYAAVSAAGVIALGLLRVAAPLIPGAGPLVKGAADLAWAALATRDQKRTDQAQAVITHAATVAQPVLQALSTVPPADLPPALASALADPRIAQAITQLGVARAATELPKA